MTLVRNYQRMLDTRLSNPKKLQKVDQTYVNKNLKVFKNSAFDQQQTHQSAFKKFNKTAGTWAQFYEDEPEKAEEAAYMTHLEQAFSKNFRRYDQIDKP